MGWAIIAKPTMSFTAIALAAYGAVLSSLLAAARLVRWIRENRPRLDVRLFVSPLVVGEDDKQPLVQNELGYPVIQSGRATGFLVIRAHNRGKKTVTVDRVEFVGDRGRRSNVTWVALPRTLEPDAMQLWYSAWTGQTPGIAAAVTLRGGKVFRSRRYDKLLGYLSPLDPIAGR
jgi:hypothetical protein